MGTVSRYIRRWDNLGKLFWITLKISAAFVFLRSAISLKNSIMNFSLTQEVLMTIASDLVQLFFSFMAMRSLVAWTWLMRRNRDLEIQAESKAGAVDMEQYVRNEKREQAELKEERQISEQRIMSGVQQQIEHFSEDQRSRMGSMNSEIQKNKESMDDINKKILGVQTEMRQSFNSLQETLKKIQREDLLPKTEEEKDSEKTIQEELRSEIQAMEQQEYENGEVPEAGAISNDINPSLEQVPEDEELPDFRIDENVTEIERFVDAVSDNDDYEDEEPEPEDEGDYEEDSDFNPLTGN